VQIFSDEGEGARQFAPHLNTPMIAEQAIDGTLHWNSLTLTFCQKCIGWLIKNGTQLHALRKSSNRTRLASTVAMKGCYVEHSVLRAGCSKHRLELTTRLTRGISPVNSWRVVPRQNPRVKTCARLTRELKLTSG